MVLSTVQRGYRLEVPDWWNEYVPAVREQWMNGCGLESWPDELRVLLDTISGFRAAADVHDVEGYMAGHLLDQGLIGPEEYGARIDYSNYRFKRNCLAIMKQDGVTWWRRPRLWWRRRGMVAAFYQAVQLNAVRAKREANREARRG